MEDVSDSMNGRIGRIDLTNLNISILPENIGNLTYLGEIKKDDSDRDSDEEKSF